jgi:hypothetical protein
VLDVEWARGVATVKHQSKIFLVPLRHLRPHVIPLANFCTILLNQKTDDMPTVLFNSLFLTGQPTTTQQHFLRHLLHPDELAGIKQFQQYNNNNDQQNKQMALAFATIMDMIDELIPNKPMIAGRISTSEGWISTNLESRIFAQAKLFAQHNKDLSHFDGIRAGTRCTHLAALPTALHGSLFTWLRNQHEVYSFLEVSPNKSISFKSTLGASWHDSSFLLFYAIDLKTRTPQQN